MARWWSTPRVKPIPSGRSGERPFSFGRFAMSRIRVAPAALLLALAASSLTAEVVTLQAAASLRGLNPVLLGRARLQHVLQREPRGQRDLPLLHRPVLQRRPPIPPSTSSWRRGSRGRSTTSWRTPARSMRTTRRRHRVRVFRLAGPAGRHEPALSPPSRSTRSGCSSPALPASRAYANSILTSIRHDAPNGLVAGFRTNVGALQPGGLLGGGDTPDLRLRRRGDRIAFDAHGPPALGPADLGSLRGRRAAPTSRPRTRRSWSTRRLRSSPTRP